MLTVTCSLFCFVRSSDGSAREGDDIADRNRESRLSLQAGFWCIGYLLAMIYGAAMTAHLFVVGIAKSEL